MKIVRSSLQAVSAKYLSYQHFQTCAMEVNCETLAVMGATLANGGVCPITSEAALGPEAVRDVLSLMHR